MRQKNRTLAEELAGFLTPKTAHGVQVREIVQMAGDRGFGLLLVFASLPLLIPMPPGVSSIIGIAVSFFALQALLGRHRIWLPARVLGWRLSPRAIRFVIHRALPLLAWVERVGRTKEQHPVTGKLLRLAAAVTLVLGLVMAAPIPFFNTPPAVVTLALGAGMLKGNARLVWLGIFFGLVLVVVVIGGLGALTATLADLFRFGT